MNIMLTVVAIETVHHDYRPTFVHFCKKSMFNDDKVQVGKDQEKAQSEKDSHSKNRGGKKPN